jgi:signal transduction histidine kinase
VLLANAREHARGDVRVEARRDGAFVVVAVVDGGRAIGEAKREIAFTVEGQGAIKGTADGRYGRYLGLLAAHAAIATLGGSVSAHGVDGAARFELRFPAG